MAPTSELAIPAAGDPCPTCGSPLRLTTYKRGPKSGRPLIVCSDYSCPTLFDVEEGDLTPRQPVAGESAQAHYERERTARVERLRTAVPYLAALAVLAAATTFFLALTLVEVRWAAGAALGVVLFFVWYVGRQLPDVLDWRHGAEAERRVGLSLSGLEPLGFVTLYDRRLRGRGGNIDSITVGPTGVFVVETKYRRRSVDVINGRLEVGGREQDEVIRQVTDLAMLVQVSIAEAMNKHRLTVVPMICIGNRKIATGRAAGVSVVSANEIAKSISTGPTVLEAADVQELARILDDALPAFDRR